MYTTVCSVTISTKKSVLYLILVGILHFNKFFKSHLEFQKTTQGFYVDFSFLEIELKKT